LEFPIYKGITQKQIVDREKYMEEIVNINQNNNLQNNEDAKKNMIVLDAFSIDYFKADAGLDIKLQEYTKIPFTEISALGSAFSSLVPALQGAAGNLYTVELANGGELVRAVGTNGFRGYSMGANGIQEQAVLRKAGTAGVNAATLFMSIAIMGVQHEIKELQKMHTELLEIIERDKKSQLMADMELLSEYAENYKYYWQNSATVTVNLNQVKNIKRNARKDMISYRDEIENILDGKMETILNYGAPKKINKLSDRFSHYRLALYVYSFALYMEALLSQNFNSDYLGLVSDELKKYFDDYRVLYTRCYNEIEHSMKTALGAQLAGGVAAGSKFLGKQLRKIEFIGRGSIDDLLEANGTVIEEKEAERLETIKVKFISYKDSGIDTFANNINTINTFYNKPVELLWDKENLYIGQYNDSKQDD